MSDEEEEDKKFFKLVVCIMILVLFTIIICVIGSAEEMPPKEYFTFACDGKQVDDECEDVYYHDDGVKVKGCVSNAKYYCKIISNYSNVADNKGIIKLN